MSPLGLVTQYLRQKHSYLSRLPIIGKGAFSIVYADGPDRCIKVSICNAYREFYLSMPEDEHPHIALPNVYDYEHLSEMDIARPDMGLETHLDISLYRLERYNKFTLTNAPKESAYAVREFKGIIEGSYRYGHADVKLYYEKYMELVKQKHEIDSPAYLFYEQLGMISANSGYNFDGYKRSNFATNQEGKAVLLDPLFDCRLHRKLYCSNVPF
ncbi:hypothetical protein Presley_35 [Acinetobacter phage Presley]|uniref:Uncharacterized protein n=1 Tax=Acinetobacter phage Presley TaxID=1406780 RepID=U5PZN2_9CAUD|nr:hypothetical protein Presley_35 [Acinetobacter phage Presley]AGY48102.1 hypothetical protein Presley_35 [Acinetobacter phage Presley]